MNRKFLSLKKKFLKRKTKQANQSKSSTKNIKIELVDKSFVENKFPMYAEETDHEIVDESHCEVEGDEIDSFNLTGVSSQVVNGTIGTIATSKTNFRATVETGYESIASDDLKTEMDESQLLTECLKKLSDLEKRYQYLEMENLAMKKMQKIYQKQIYNLVNLNKLGCKTDKILKKSMSCSTSNTSGGSSNSSSYLMNASLVSNPSNNLIDTSNSAQVGEDLALNFDRKVNVSIDSSQVSSSDINSGNDSSFLSYRKKDLVFANVRNGYVRRARKCSTLRLRGK